MAKQSGLGDNLYVGGYNLSGDVGSLSRIGGGPAAIDVTGIDKSAIERIGGQRDGSLQFSSFFNDAAGQSHPVLSALPRSDVVVSYFRGTTIGNAAASLVGKQINYDGSRADDGAFTFSVDAQANAFGLEWGRMLSAGIATAVGAGGTTSVDLGTGTTAFGFQAYLHVFSFTGTDATIKIQQSSDNNVGDPWADITGGASFPQITAARVSHRITGVSATTSMERYVRLSITTTGGFTNMQYAVMLVRNETAVTF